MVHKSQYTGETFEDKMDRDLYDRGYLAAREEADEAEDERDGEILPPAPDEVALAFCAALMTGADSETPLENIVARAWGGVPSFYIWREKYAQQIAPMFFTPSS
jgi:hypothetical protein